MSETDPLDTVRELSAIGGRAPGTDAERRAAKLVAGRLRDAGRRVRLEATTVNPQWPTVQALTATLIVAASLASPDLPAPAFGVVLAALATSYLDLHGRFMTFRRLFFRRGSQNVVSPGGNPDAPWTLILTANHDAPRTGVVGRPGGRRLVRRFARVGLGPLAVPFWAGTLLLPTIGLRMAGVEGEWISAVQLIPTVVLILSVPLLADIALSVPSPGANDNASGVAAVLEVARNLDAEPPEHLDVWVLSPGGGDALRQGTRAFLRAHRKDLDRRRTAFLDLHAVGRGSPRWLSADGLVVTYDLDARLADMAGAVAGADPELGAGPASLRLGTDALPPRLRRYPSIGITTLEDDREPPFGWRSQADRPEELDPEAIERAVRLATGIARLLDRDVGRSLPAVEDEAEEEPAAD